MMIVLQILDHQVVIDCSKLFVFQHVPKDLVQFEDLGAPLLLLCPCLPLIWLVLA